MDKCSIWELNDIIENIPYLDRNKWETARFNAYVVAQVNSKKHLTQQDLLKFKWEEEDISKEERDIEISNEDIERLKQLSVQLNDKDIQWQKVN